MRRVERLSPDGHKNRSELSDEKIHALNLISEKPNPTCRTPDPGRTGGFPEALILS